MSKYLGLLKAEKIRVSFCSLKTANSAQAKFKELAGSFEAESDVGASDDASLAA